MLKITSEKQLLDYLVKKLKDTGCLDFCKECAEKTGGCCKIISPYARPNHLCPYSKNGKCTKRSVTCSLYFCTKLSIHFPELEEEFKKIQKKLKYIQLIKFPMEV